MRQGRGLAMKLGKPASILGLLLVTVFWSVPSPADEVILKTGGRLFGTAHREAGWVRVELEQGGVAFPESVVEAVIPGISPAQRKVERRAQRLAWLEARLAATDPANAQMFYRIAEDARRRGFPESELRVILGMTLGADPDHAGARADLGHVRYRGRWLPDERAEQIERRDYAREMREAGWILDRGEWVTPTESEWRHRESRWRAIVSEIETERDRLRRERDGLAALLTSTESELAGAGARIRWLEGDVDRLECDVANLRGELGACELALASMPRPACRQE